MDFLQGLIISFLVKAVLRQMLYARRNLSGPLGNWKSFLWKEGAQMTFWDEVHYTIPTQREIQGTKR